MPEILIMVGCIGSGKSFNAEKIATPDTMILSADKCRERLFGSAEVQGGSDVWDLFYSEYRECMKLDLPIIVDNTNLRRKDRNRIVALAQENKYKYKFIIIDKPLDVCLRQNSNRSRVVPEDIVNKFYERFLEAKASIITGQEGEWEIVK